MITFLVLMVTVAIIGIIAVLFFGASSIVVLLVFGDVIIGAFLVYKIIKAIAKK